MNLECVQSDSKLLLNLETSPVTFFRQDSFEKRKNDRGGYHQLECHSMTLQTVVLRSPHWAYCNERFKTKPAVHVMRNIRAHTIVQQKNHCL